MTSNPHNSLDSKVKKSLEYHQVALKEVNVVDAHLYVSICFCEASHTFALSWF